MAVYTKIDSAELQAFLRLYDVGELLRFEGILDGTENTNYQVVTSKGHYVLTLYEQRVDVDDLPFFTRLLRHLGDKGYPCPPPLIQNSGQAIGHIAKHHAALIPFLSGHPIRNPDPHHCAAVGKSLAQLHLAAQDFPEPHRANAMSRQEWHRLYHAIAEHADAISSGLRQELSATLADIDSNWPADLPAGICHTDLFTDNILFSGNTISGVIDFYFACHDYWLYDLANTVSAWSFSPFGSFYYSNSVATIRAYHQIRPLTSGEYSAFVLIMQASALRFLLTRLYDWINIPANAMVKPRNPLEYVRVLRFVRQIETPSFFGLTADMINHD